MRPLCVVKADPFIDDLLGLEAVSDFVQIDGLLFQGSPKAFDEDVVQISPAPVCYRQMFARKLREASRF